MISADSHYRFLREDDDKHATWDDQVAQKYYSSLYREFAVCDLKHYKSGNVSSTIVPGTNPLIFTLRYCSAFDQFALRWRTEAEVLSGAGETSCGNTRCASHDVNVLMPPLSTLELPFVYEEQRETKTALVKVVLCGRCVKKLMWKREKEKEHGLMSPDSGERSGDDAEKRTNRKRRQVEDDDGQPEARAIIARTRRRSRSRSPPPWEKVQSRRRRPS
jgi:protein FRA10AC1